LSKGKVILIPCTLGDVNPFEVLPECNTDFINSCDVLIVENLRSARRFLKKIRIKKEIDDFQFFEINKRTKLEHVSSFLSTANTEVNIGVLSEAGCPGIADPGAEIVRWAHKKNIEVIPLIGPSSILLALMASGMNGQSFAFKGYLPKNKTDRRKEIKYLEQFSKTHQQTQIFIETPFRNNQLLDDLRTYCYKDTQIVVACDITLPTQYIKRLSAKDWKKEKVNLHKRPCIFILHKY
tara:strand:+ start:603 stop:1313 length:711 start_codon:yes stop_codon:yes gene_type:complete